MSSNQQQDRKSYGFTESIQKRIVAMLLHESDSVVENIEIIRPEYFDYKVLSDFVRIIEQFYTSYSRAPNYDEFIEEVSRYLSSESELPKEQYWKTIEELVEIGEEGEFEYVRDQVVNFARYQAVKRAMVESVDELRTSRNYTSIVEKIRIATMVGEELESLGTFYIQNLEERLRHREERGDRAERAIPTGLSQLDYRLGGGVAPPELAILLAPMKRGKTITVANFGFSAVLDGKNVLHYPLEGSQESMEEIYDSLVSGIERENLKGRSEEIREHLYSKIKGRGAGDLVIKHFPPNYLSPARMEKHIQLLKFRHHFIPDLVIIDYLGLMISSQRKADISDRYQYLGLITKELLSLAHKYHFAIWLLHQGTRKSKTKNLVDITDAADSIEPMRDADLIVSINQSDVEAKKEGVQGMEFFIAGGRMVRDRGSNIVVSIDKAKCQVFEAIGEEYEKK